MRHDLLPLLADNGAAAGCAATIAACLRVDILVNNLGVYEAVGFFDETDESWLRLFEVNIMMAGSSPLSLLSSQNHASAICARHKAPVLISHIAFNQAYDAPPLDDAACGFQPGFPDRLQEVDFEFQRREGFSLIERGCESYSHRGVRDIAENSAMKRAHRISVRLASFKFDDRLAMLNRYETKTDQLRNRRGHRFADHPLLYLINHLGHYKSLLFTLDRVTV
jgi:NAD(P)-dependent dehydrogenase (short-subunit alcohol dehydrogenase family)